jgi:hypothetical protein
LFAHLHIPGGHGIIRPGLAPMIFVLVAPPGFDSAS